MLDRAVDLSPYVTEEFFTGEDNERLTPASLRGAIATKQSSLLIHWIASLTIRSRALRA
jgi:hypothetical protein